MLTLYVCSKTDSLASNETVKLDLSQQDESEVSSKLTVDNLMIAIKEKLSLTGSLEDYQLVCFGKKLKGDRLLSQYGIKSNAVVHLFMKNAEERSANKKMDVDSNPKGKGKKAKFDQSEVHAMVIASRTALMNQSFRQMLSRFHENDFRNNLIQCTPGLKDDPIAIAVLHDADLLTMMMDPSIIEKVLEKHPAILEAATHLATAFHEESATLSGRSGSAPMVVDPSQFSYSLDELSEDDEMTGGVDAPPPNGQHVMSPTTASAFAHLMQQALLASHSSQRGTSGGSGGSQHNQAQLPPPPPMTLPPNHTPQQLQQFQLAQLQQLQAQHLQQQQQSSQTAQQQQQQQTRQPDNAIIAFEMLRHALQLTEPSTSQQGNNSAQGSASNPLTCQSSANITSPPRPDMSRQIAQMRELGLTDENVCLQALIATNGDVQAAIELIFSETSHS